MTTHNPLAFVPAPHSNTFKAEPGQPVIINFNVNVDRNGNTIAEPEDEGFHICEDVADFTCCIQMAKDGLTKEDFELPVEELVRKADEKLGQFRTALHLNLDAQTVLQEAASASVFLMLASEAFIEDKNDN